MTLECTVRGSMRFCGCVKDSNIHRREIKDFIVLHKEWILDIFDGGTEITKKAINIGIMIGNTVAANNVILEENRHSCGIIFLLSEKIYRSDEEKVSK